MKKSQNQKAKINYNKLLLLVIIILAVVWVACGQEKETAFKNIGEENIILDDELEQSEANNEHLDNSEVEPKNENMGINPLTGLLIDKNELDKRAVAVMINNHKLANPQSGISKADIIYEVPVEGEFVRFLAVFQDLNVDKIGPIRSARHYFMDYAFDNNAIYVHFGHSDQALKAISDLSVPSLDGINPKYEAIMTWRDSERKKTRGLEHSAYTSGKKIIAAWNKAKYKIENDSSYKPIFSFAEKLIETSDWLACEKITIPYSYYQKSVFEYDSETQKYKRFQFDAPHIDVENNKQLEFDNIIIQYQNIYPIKGDAYGRKDIDTVGNGNGVYITKGKMVPIKWSKTSHKSPIKYTHEDGQALELNKGKTWISVVDKKMKADVKYE